MGNIQAIQSKTVPSTHPKPYLGAFWRILIKIKLGRNRPLLDEEI